MARWALALVGLVAWVFACVSPVQAQSSASQTEMGYLTTSGCPAGRSPCWVSFGPSIPTTSAQVAYQLLGVPGGAGATATGAAVGPVLGGSYILSCLGTLNGATLQMQALGPDGATWFNVTGASYSALPGSPIGVVFGSSAGSTVPNARMLVTGGTPSGLYCALS